MADPSPPLRFQAHSATWALLTAGPLLLFAGVLLLLSFWIDSWGWMAFSALAVAACVALVTLRMPVTIEPGARTVQQSWCIGPIPIVRKQRDLGAFDFVQLAPYSRQKGLMSRSLWRLLEPRYRLSLFGEDAAVPLDSFYRHDKALVAAQQAARALDLDVYDTTVKDSY